MQPFQRLDAVAVPIAQPNVDTDQIFDIYYDRAMKSLDDRKGQWFIYRELREE